jgi:hypothetical protein
MEIFIGAGAGRSVLLEYRQFPPVVKLSRAGEIGKIMIYP